MAKEPSRNYESLQATRGVAALLVVLYHLGSIIAAPKYFGIHWFEVPLSFGHTGVEFFFVLSGFIITYVHWHDISRPQALPRYVKRRFVRIYPIYWGVFLAVWLAALVIPAMRQVVEHESSLILKGLALLPIDLKRYYPPIIHVSWTLEYEVAFYSLFALAIINRWLMAGAIGLLIFAYGSCVHGCEYPASFFAVNIVPLFGFGALVAILERKGWSIPKPINAIFVATALFFLLGVTEIFAPSFRMATVQRMLLGIASCTIIAGLVSWEKKTPNKPNLGLIGLLGNASYVLYLLHYPMLSALCKLCVRLFPRTAVGAGVSYATILMICLATAIAVHVWVEKPILARFARRHTTDVLQRRHARDA